MRRFLLCIGVAALILFAVVIVNRLGREPLCEHCGGQLVVTRRLDDQYITATFWKCESCGRHTVDHVWKDTGDGRYFDRQ